MLGHTGRVPHGRPLQPQFRSLQCLQYVVRAPGLPVDDGIGVEMGDGIPTRYFVGGLTPKSRPFRPTYGNRGEKAVV